MSDDGRRPTCREVLTFLLDYVEDELEPAPRAAFDRHLERCPSCVAYLDSYLKTVALSSSAWSAAVSSSGALPSDLEQAVLAALREGRPGPSG